MVVIINIIIGLIIIIFQLGITSFCMISTVSSALYYPRLEGSFSLSLTSSVLGFFSLPHLVTIFNFFKNFYSFFNLILYFGHTVQHVGA